MKKNVGPIMDSYPTPVTVIGAMNGARPTWTLVAHVGIIGHDRVLVSTQDKPDYNTLKPVLFQFPTYKYLKTGDVLGKCLSFKKTAQ